MAGGRPIRFGIYHRGIESTFMALPAFRNSPDSVVQFEDTAHGRNLSTIYEGLVRIEHVPYPIRESQAFYQYGNPSRKDNLVHICQRYTDTFEMGHDNYIPRMRFTDEDLGRADTFLKAHPRAVCINPMAGQFYRDQDISKHTRMMAMDRWTIIVETLRAAGHSVLYFTSPRNYVPIPNTVPLLDLTFRQMCALFRLSGSYIGIENGMMHGAVAAGARCYSLIPGWQDPTFYWPNSVYLEPMWKHEPRRVWYHTFDEVPQLLATFQQHQSQSTRHAV